MNYDYRQLKRFIKKQFKFGVYYAKFLGISKSDLSLKLNNKRSFTREEILKTVNECHLSTRQMYAYFFTEKYEEGGN